MLLGVVFGPGRAPLVAAFGPARFRSLRDQARAELPRLLAALPDTDGKGGARYFLTDPCHLVAFPRAAGLPAAESAALFQAGLRHASRWIPLLVRRLYRWLWFQPWFYRWLSAGTFGGAGFEGVLLGDGPGALGVDYTGCGIQQFLRGIGATDVGPHLCALDELESEVFGLGRQPTGTLGRGAPRCDFRWRRPSPVGGRGALGSRYRSWIGQKHAVSPQSTTPTA